MFSVSFSKDREDQKKGKGFRETRVSSHLSVQFMKENPNVYDF